MTSSVPSLMASRARSVAWRGCSVNSYLKSRMKCLRPSRISLQRLRVRPRLEAGLTMTLVLSRIGGSWRRRGRRYGRAGRQGLLPEQGDADDAAQGAHDGENRGGHEEPEQEPACRDRAAALIEDVVEPGGHLTAELARFVEDALGQAEIEGAKRDADDGVRDGGDDAGQGPD